MAAPSRNAWFPAGTWRPAGTGGTVTWSAWAGSGCDLRYVNADKAIGFAFDIHEADFRDAIALTREMSAKALELRAATGLARLWRDQGQRAEARDLLPPVYGWFTEGFDTADLKETKTLLEALNA